MSDPNPKPRLTKRTLLILLIGGAVLYSSLVTAVGLLVLRQRPVPPLKPVEDVAPPVKVEEQPSQKSSLVLPPASGTLVATMTNNVSDPEKSAIEELNPLPSGEDTNVAASTQLLPHADPVGQPLPIRHPLVIELSKSAYDKRAEIRSTLTAGNVDDAAKHVVSVNSEELKGLVRDSADRDRFVSMSTELAEFRREFPDLQETIQQQYLTQGWVRVRSAMQSVDVEAVSLVAGQFADTEVASEAFRWLGDQAIAVGEFSSAEWHYERATQSANVPQRKDLDARLILASALHHTSDAAEVSNRISSQPDSSIAFNEKTVSKSEFAAIIQDLAVRPTPNNEFRHATNEVASPFPAASLKLVKRAEYDGPAGHDPGRWEFRLGDPFARQIAVESGHDRFFVSNRFHVNAYSNESGQLIWSRVFEGEQGDAYAQAFTSMQPLLCGDRLFVRHLKRSGAHLACLDAASGDVVWNRLLSLGALSDPFEWNGELCAFLISKRDDEQFSVDFAKIDPKTGETGLTQPLFGLSSTFEDGYSARTAVVGRYVILTVGGCTARVDWDGSLVWIRQHTMQHRSEDDGLDFRRLSPVVVDNRVIVAQPDVAEVTCLEMATGKVAWERMIPETRGILGRADSLILIDTASGLEALDAADGATRWHTPLNDRLDAFAISDRKLIVATRESSEDGLSRPAIQKLDPQTGAILDTIVPNVSARREYQLGPLFSSHNKWWCLVGESWNDQRRELHELISVL